VGGCWSTTVIVNEHWFVLPKASVTVQVTVFGPLLKVDPGGGVQLTVQVSFCLGTEGLVDTLEHGQSAVAGA
jgi:hypothetical protein